MFEWLRKRAGWKQAPDGTSDESIAKLLAMRFGVSVPIWNDWSAEVAFKHGFHANAWVYACIQRRAEAAMQVPWVVERKDREGDWREVEDSHPLHQLMERPNSDMDAATLVERLVQHLDLAGNAYWAKLRAGENGRVVELWPLQPDGMEVKPGHVRLVDKYAYQYGTKRREFRPDDIVHFRTSDPDSPYFGTSPLRPGGHAVDLDNEASNWQKTSFQNRGISDIHFEVPSDTTKEQLDLLKERFYEKQAGSDNARKALFSSAKATAMNMTAVELDFSQSRRDIRVEICSVLAVPPPMVGIYDDATLNNMRTSREIFWQDGMVPLLNRIERILNLSVTPEFGSDIRIRADLSGVEALQAEYSKLVEQAERLWRMGLPFNVINQTLELGFESMPGHDVGYLPAGLLPTDFDLSSESNRSATENRAVDLQIMEKLAYGPQDR